MLTEKEHSTICNAAAKTFLANAFDMYKAETLGVVGKVNISFESFLYAFALGTYEYGKEDNYLSEEQLQAIYSRLREISDV